MRWQLPIVWLTGSAVTGTLAVLMTHDRPDGLPFTPLVRLSGQEVLSLILLVAALFLSLFALAWRTIEATWLHHRDGRSAILWTILVGGAGLVGWGFAAVVTFDAGFTPTAQLVLAYLGGGLPFTLVAAMLARPVLLNGAAALLTATAVVTGLALMRSPILTLVDYLLLLVG